MKRIKPMAGRTSERAGESEGRIGVAGARPGAAVANQSCSEQTVDSTRDFAPQQPWRRVLTTRYTRNCVTRTARTPLQFSNHRLDRKPPCLRRLQRQLL